MEFSDTVNLTRACVFEAISRRSNVKEREDRTDNGKISHTDLFGVTFLDYGHAGEPLRVTRELLLDSS